MKAYRIYDNEQQRFIKIGKRSNDLYVNLELVEHSLKAQFKVDCIKPRFDIIEYDLVRTRKIYIKKKREMFNHLSFLLSY